MHKGMEVRKGGRAFGEQQGSSMANVQTVVDGMRWEKRENSKVGWAPLVHRKGRGGPLGNLGACL